jgi:D-alanyl-D-alanine carboxypeptidase (penicillin-binding protein 5/6)
MVLKRSLAAVLLVFITVAILPPPVIAVDIVLTARFVLLVDSQYDEVLYSKASRERAFPASLTKIMTSLLVLEYIEEDGSLDEMVTVTASSQANFNPVGSNAGLLIGERMSLRDMLYCIIVASANDACDAVAEHISGSVEAFIERMNERAGELGLEDTHFINTHGLHDPNHFTTAWDIYAMVRAAMEYPLYLEICHTESRIIEATNLRDEFRITTTNHMISRLRHGHRYYYAPAVGIKTGLTSAAGYCLVTTAEQGSLQLVSIVMGAEGPHIGTGMESFPHNSDMMNFIETRNLLQWGFNNFERKTLMPALNLVAETSVRMGISRDHVQLITASPIEAVVLKGLDPDTLRRDIEHFYPDGIDAPVVRGQRMGRLVLRDDVRVYGETELIAGNEIERSQASYFADQFQEIVRQPWVRYAILGAAGLVALYIAYVLAVNAVRRRRKAREGNYRGSKRRHKR